MINKNKAAYDYQRRAVITASNHVSNPVYGLASTGGGLLYTWGKAFSAGSMGVQVQFVNDFVHSTHKYTWSTPWGSGTSSEQGFQSAPKFRLYFTGEKLVVNPDCTWFYSHQGLTIYVAYGGGGETAILTVGPQSMSGTTYDERLNVTQLQDFCGPSAPTISGYCGTGTNGSWSDGSATLGGYEYYKSGAWTEDQILVDTTLAEGACPTCLLALPLIAGTTSYNMTVASSVTASQIYTTGITVPCPGCTPNFNTGTYTETHYAAQTCNALNIKHKDSGVGSQTITYSWICTTPSGDTADSGSSTTTPSLTKCSALRAVRSIYNAGYCWGASPACFGANHCTYPPNPPPYCDYDLNEQLTWPTLPVCVPADIALGYDVSQSFRHCRTFGRPATGHIFLGTAGNLAPISFDDVDTGISATWARPRFQDFGTNRYIGMIYGDGSNVYWARTYDEGATWVDTTSLGSGKVGDFEECKDGRKIEFKLVINGATYDVWAQILDNNLNVITAWAITNLTSVDNEPIACRESIDNSVSAVWRIGLMHVVSGSVTARWSNDAYNFA